MGRDGPREPWRASVDLVNGRQCSPYDPASGLADPISTCEGPSCAAARPFRRSFVLPESVASETDDDDDDVIVVVARG